jgi:hypothetical protein
VTPAEIIVATELFLARWSRRPSIERDRGLLQAEREPARRVLDALGWEEPAWDDHQLTLDSQEALG